MEIVSEQKQVKANKEHRCNYCGYPIRQGQTYNTATFKSDGIYTWKSHLHCDDISDRLKMHEGNNYDEGLTGEVFQEIIGDQYIDIIRSTLTKDEIIKHIQILQQLRSVYFYNKLMFVIHHYAKIDANHSH